MRAHWVHVEHDFGKPPERIFAHLAEHENLAEVFGAKVTRLNDGEDGTRNGVGSRRQLRIGRLAPFEETVTEFAPVRAHRLPHHQGQPAAWSRGDDDVRAQRRGHALPVRHSHRLADPGLALIVRTMLTRSIVASLPAVEGAA